MSDNRKKNEKDVNAFLKNNPLDIFIFPDQRTIKLKSISQIQSFLSREIDFNNTLLSKIGVQPLSNLSNFQNNLETILSGHFEEGEILSSGHSGSFKSFADDLSNSSKSIMFSISKIGTLVQEVFEDRKRTIQSI